MESRLRIDRARPGRRRRPDSLLLESGIDLNKGYFKGPITGSYDGATHSFTFGKWNVLEFKNGNPVPGYGLVLTKLGGNRIWDAKHESTVPTSIKPDAGAADAGPELAQPPHSGLSSASPLQS